MTGKFGYLAALLGSVLVLAPLSSAPGDAERYWPQWRGPFATGVSKVAKPPLAWSETKNIRWKKEIPGRGSGTPVVWGDHVFVATAVPAGKTLAESHAPLGGVTPRVAHKFIVMALDRRDGRVAWEHAANEATPHEGSHNDNGTWASPSAVTDGEHVIASFESFGIYAYDMNGKLVWSRDLGDKQMRSQFGEGSSPVLHGNTLVVVWDQFVPGQSFIAALDKRTGKELWRQKRDEIDTWATPAVVETGGRAQVIVPAMNRVRSYDLQTGDVVWEMAGLTMNPIPSPVAEDGLVILMSGFRGNSLKAVRVAAAKGDITGSDRVVWTLDRDTPYVPSPLLYDGVLYFFKSNSGVLSVFDAKTGKPHYQLQRIDGVPNVFASPVGAAGRVYIPGREGTTVVFRHGSTFEILATNKLDDGFDASPALVDNEIYLRGTRHLYSIAEK